MISIEDVSALNFKEYIMLFEKLGKQAEESPEQTAEQLSDFDTLLTGKELNLDMLPTAAKTFVKITSNMTKPQINKAVHKLVKQGKGILFERDSGIICKNPACAEIVFNHFADKGFSLDPQEFNNNMRTVSNMVSAVSAAPDEALPEMMKKINSFPEPIQKLFFANYGTLYARKPALRAELWDKFVHYRPETSEYSKMYQNLGAVAAADAEKIPQCLRLIAENLEKTNQTPGQLKEAYNTLGKIRSTYPNKAEIDGILEQGLKNPVNNRSSQRAAYRQMGKVDELISSSSIGQRVEKTADNPHGFKLVEDIKPDEPAVLILGGNSTNSNRSANGYLSPVEKLLKTENLQDKVGLYAAIYDFGEIDDLNVTFQDGPARIKLMQDKHRKIKVKRPMNEDTLNPRYIDDLFDKVFLNRISDKDGQRLSTEEACAKMRKLTVVAHCHGAYTLLKLEEKMKQKMAEIGYSPAECAKVQHELLCVAHAPYAPLGVSKSTMISFVSAKDFEVEHFNSFEHEVHALSQNNAVLMSYFPEKRGEFFLTPSMGKDVEEHNFLGYDLNQKRLSPEGKAMLKFAGNAVVNGVKNSLEGKTLPPVKEIVCGQDAEAKKLFNKLKENGAEMWQIISKNITARFKAARAKQLSK